MQDGKHIHRYKFWDPSTWTIPKLYWDAFSQEQRIHAICRQLSKVIAYADYVGSNMDEVMEQYVELQELFEKFMQSGFDDYYADQVEAWIDSHLQYIFDHTVKQVYFGLTDDGHFIAYIPESWDDIFFDTGFDYSLDTYGRLILRWDVDNSNPATQTPYESNSQGIGD